MPRRARPVFLAPLVLAAACGGEATPPAAPPPAASVASAPSPTAPPAPRAYEPLPPRFENPGGMWMPAQMKDHAAKLKELGLAIDPAALSDPTSGVLSAIVYLGGCSASFVSPEGLVATNHHCATGALQHNSTAQQNLLKEGFLAKTRAEEKNNGPRARVLVTRAVTDVTSKVMGGLEGVADDRARHLEAERRQKELVAACEKGRAGTRCSVKPFYEATQYFLVEQLEIRDVRLVWAPPVGVGNYGGEIDNWRWPRHTGDVSLFRAYVGKDGAPADYSPENVPYKPPHWLRIAQKPLAEGDLVFVAGYPARTNVLKTRAEANEAIAWGYPWRQKLYEDYLARLADVTKDDKEAQIRATTYVRRFGNALTNTKGQLEGLVKGGLAEEKEKSERELRAFIDADPARKAKWGTALDDVAREIDKRAAYRDLDAFLRYEVQLPQLVSAATTIVRMAEERAKPDSARDPEYQERNLPQHVQAMKGLASSYHRKVDEALLVLALERASTSSALAKSPVVAAILTARGGSAKDTSPAAIAKAVATLYAGTKLDDEATRVALLTKASTAELKASKDSLVRLAVVLRPMLKESEERAHRFAGRMLVLEPKVMAARIAFAKTPLAPEANGTLRITYGTVRGYRPTPTAPVYRPFTSLSEVVAKNQGKEPFDVPAPVLAAYKAKRVGGYVDAKLGDVPVDFLADLHITGGNSGSATLDARGDLVGLAFDGNYEAMASDWVFVPSVTRSIHVDVRYVLWLLDGPFGGDAILREMGVSPKL